MSRVTRSEFLRGGAALAAAALAGLRPETCEAAAPPDVAAPLPSPRGPGVRAQLVVVNARVYTMDEDLPRAAAFAVHEGRFLAVGGNDEIRNLAAPGTEIIDARGMTAVPGFIDTHSHPDGVSELINVDVDLGSIAAIQPSVPQSRMGPKSFWASRT